MDTQIKNKQEVLYNLISTRLRSITENRDRILSEDSLDKGLDNTFLHDINTPLHSIFNAVEQLKRVAQDSSSLELLQVIESAATSMQRTLSGLVSRPAEVTKAMSSESYPWPDIILQILVVEDNAVNAKLAQNILVKNGYNVHVANNGKEAFDLALNNRYDLILMDVEMPVMNGIETTKQLRLLEKEGKIDYRPVIIAVTADNTEAIRHRCFESGMDGFLSKPFKWDQLPEVIKTFQSFKNRGNGEK